MKQTRQAVRAIKQSIFLDICASKSATQSACTYAKAAIEEHVLDTYTGRQLT